MSKYEFKEFSYDSYTSDLSSGWSLTFRISEDYQGQEPRPVEIIDLGPRAENESRLASIDIRNGGEVCLHDMHGMYYDNGGKCYLDLVLYREARPKPKEILGMVYVNADNKVVSVRCEEDSELSVAGTLRPVPCTITLHEPV